MAHDGISALNMLSKDIPDLIILDIVMPEMSGHEVLQKIKETAKWYSLFLEGKDVSKVSLEQINAYFEGELN